MAKTVIILGAGVGGLSVAAKLRESLPEQDRIILIDERFEGVLGLSLLWVLRGWRTPDEVVYRPAPAVLPGVDLVKATVKLVDPERKRVVTSEEEFAGDALVIALGAELAPSATPGLEEALDGAWAGEFFTLHGAAALGERARKLGEGRLGVVVAGTPFKCPAAPFEGALLLADLLGETGARERVRVDAYTPDPLPMPVAGPAIGEALVGMLTAYGIGFHGGRVAEAFDGSTGEIVFADGGRERFDLVAVVPPHRPPAAVRAAGLGPSGWIAVDRRTLATSAPGVWAIGDVTLLTLPNGKPLPKAAVFAEGAADVVAHGVLRHLGLPAPEPWFDGLGSCYIEVGGRMSAKGEGRFLDEPAPTVTLHEPSLAFHDEKAAQEAVWLKRWNER
ncbi:FAD/NAD(P)-binding oxidoreductase [Nonomuraea bangladeshensis]|uniref:FAD/NAD(P)-binding oxidoreductase n=1 Tax=Nonomuraea bangladeshensis TaxID=404385 RepID=A0ABV3GZ32_9ACTN